MEFRSYSGQQMLRKGRWEAVRQDLKTDPDGPVELYDIESDNSEKMNLADKYPDTVKELWEIMKQEHVRSREFPFESLDQAVTPQNIR